VETGRVNSVLSDQAHPLLASGAKETRCTSLLESLPQVMPSESLAPAVSPSQLAPSALLIAVAVFATSAVLCVIGYLALTVSGPWVGGPSERHWTAQELTVRRGDARPGKDGISVLGPDETGIVVIALNASLRSRDYPVIAWDALNVPDGVEATLLWYSDFRASRTLTRALAIEGHRIAPTDLAQDRNWIGTIGGLALALRGSFGEPIFVRGVSAKPMTPTQILSDRAREWVAFEPWNGASINAVTGGADVQDLPLPTLLAAIVLVGGLVYVALARWTPNLVGSFRPAIVAVGFLAAWLALDARWQWNLLRQADATIEQYAGKSWRERHLVAEDGALFAFIEQARGKLPPAVEAAPRVFMVADSDYLRGRGAYYLYPYNVYFDPAHDSIPSASTMRAGDYLLAYSRGRLLYKPASGRLSWGAGESVAAELLLGEPGAALFRVR
jgi:hypothetical protein